MWRCFRNYFFQSTQSAWDGFEHLPVTSAEAQRAAKPEKNRFGPLLISGPVSTLEHNFDFLQTKAAGLLFLIKQCEIEIRLLSFQLVSLLLRVVCVCACACACVCAHVLMCVYAWVCTWGWVSVCVGVWQREREKEKERERERERVGVRGEQRHPSFSAGSVASMTK